MTWRIVLGCILLAAMALAGPAAGQVLAPRLLVIVMIDQMRADYLSVFGKHWESGIRRLMREGAIFENGAYPYANTVTCAGHATVGTGAFPRTHGMVGNSWWDRDRAVLVDCDADSSAAAAPVSYGRPARSGSSPRFIMTDTLGDVLRQRSPAARVVSLSLKPDSAIPLAGHGGEIVTWFDTEAGAFVTSRAFTATRNVAVAQFIAANPLLKELAPDWTLLKNPAAYINTDASPGQRPPAQRDGLFPHDIGSAGLWAQSPMSDRYLGRMAAAMVQALDLGRDDTPDLLAVGFSALDLVGHAFGPGSREVEDVLVNLDVTLGHLLDALDQRVGRDRYVLALTADHGVAPILQPPDGGRLITEDIQDRIDDLLLARWGPTPARGGYYARVLGPYVYFGPGVLQRLQGDSSLFQQVLRTIGDTPGVQRVIPADQLSATSNDQFIRSAALSYAAGRSGDLVIVPRQGWITVGRNTTAAATHGSPHDYDRRVPLILLGGPVRAGRFTQSATPADIAPTLAYLAGVALPKAEGRVLREALR